MFGVVSNKGRYPNPRRNNHAKVPNMVHPYLINLFCVADLKTIRASKSVIPI